MVVSEGSITWANKESTPDPEGALREEVTNLHKKMDTLIKQQSTMLEMMAGIQKGNPTPEAGGSKPPKKKQVKAKKNQD